MKHLIFYFFLCLSISINAQEICGDGIDNDGDNLIDCADISCSSEMSCQNAIACQANSVFYQVRNGSSFYQYDPNALNYTLIANNSFSINAMGYNVEDGFIYGIKVGDNSNTDNNHLVRVGADGIFQDLGDVTGLPISDSYYVGDFDLSGNLHIVRGQTSTMYKIDVSSQSATSIPLNQALNTSDFSYLVSTGNFYALNDSSSELLVVNPVTGTVTNEGALSPAIPNCSSYGASFADNNGSLYFFCNNSGKLYQVDPINGTSSLLQSTGITLSTNDGAACPLSDSLITCNNEVFTDFCFEANTNNVTFSNNSTGNGTKSYLWDFGDGTTSTAMNPTKSYPTVAGTYDVCLTVTLTDGTLCCQSCCKEISIYPPCYDNIPGPAFNYLYLNSGSIKFNNPSGAGSAFTKEWTIDGVFHSDLNQPPSKILSPGTHTVCLEVSKNSNPNCSEKFCRNILIDDPCTVPSLAKFTHEICLNSSTVDFESIASGTNSNTTYEWDFGDGNTGTASSPSHTYTDYGTYTVCVKIINSVNCIKEVCALIVVSEPDCSYTCSSNLPARMAQNESAFEFNKSKELLIMPNPVKNITKIFFDLIQEEGAQISLVDLNGKVISQNYLQKDEGSYELNTSNLPTGMYIISIRYTNGEVITSKMIKI